MVVGTGGLVALPGPSLILDLLAGPRAFLLVWQVQGFARELEYRADRRGWEAVRHAGYGAGECVPALERLQSDEQELLAEAQVREPYFYGDHPATADRIEGMRTWLQAEPVPLVNDERSRQRTVYHEETFAVRLEVVATNMTVRRFERARLLIDQEIAVSPQRAEVHVALGDWHRRNPKQRDFEAAAAAYRHALELDAHFAPAHRELGLLCWEEHNASCARTHLQRYLELAPTALDRGIVEGIVRTLAEGSP
ncbi:MAG: hypothetical protein N3C12_07245 [Candidatus Binatia bacterium]|nr:hypothetical protein [Candidatus Binatia bacterium]